MNTLAIDIETFSTVDLTKSGVYAYCDSPSFEILLFAYAFDDEEVRIVDLASNEKLPRKVINALRDEKIIKTAFNAAFERVCISKYLGINLSPKSWICTAVQGAMLGLPLSLEGVGEVLNTRNKKLKEGKDLIKYFTMPCKESNMNNNISRNLPHDDPEKWENFKRYCIRDVETERDIRHKLRHYPISKEELEIYEIDQEINDRGILVDEKLVNHANQCDFKYKEIIRRRGYELTALENLNSLPQLKSWLSHRGIVVDKLDKKSVNKLLLECDEEVYEVLKLRQLISKTSLKKYKAIENSLCKDKRVHGLFQFYGATRTGRWAGRLVQVQNLPQNHIKELELARNLLKEGKYEEIENLGYSTPEVLSQLIRSAFIPKEGYEFIVADFSAIEARVLAWISNEKWRMNVFRSHGKIYEASAGEMFNVDIDEITKESDLRQKGKIAELALGYGGSVGALTTMGALDMGLKKEELQPLVNKWRQTNPYITKFWWDVHRSSLKAVREKSTLSSEKLKFAYESGIFFITLPSKRKLAYIKPKVEPNKFGSMSLTYEGMGPTKKWERIETYGPKLVENIVQGISRDILAFAMKNLRDRGFNIVMHVHDEVVVEMKKGSKSVDEVCEIMEINPPWAKGLPLKAEGYKCDFYHK